MSPSQSSENSGFESSESITSLLVKLSSTSWLSFSDDDSNDSMFSSRSLANGPPLFAFLLKVLNFVLELFLLFVVAHEDFPTCLHVNPSPGKTSSSLSEAGAPFVFGGTNQSVTLFSSSIAANGSLLINDILLLIFALNLMKTKLCNFLWISLFLFFVWT